MGTLKSDFANGKRTFPMPSGSASVEVRAEITLAAALALNDVLYFGDLPDGCVVTDWALDSDDVDTGATLTVDLGLLNAAGSAVSSAAADGGKWLTNSTAPRAASVTRMSAGTVAEQTALARMSPTSTPRKVGAVVTAAGAGGVTNKVGLTVRYRAANGNN